ncbi:protein kinase [Bacillus sp. SB49]|uniref:serine/threonine protein kinase n=1 Tax=Bacillaceae TaxID=186817 RepID=UPI0006854D6D|nr:MULTISPECIES: protein kinase [Bacillaceae]QHT46329.1 protein kinase [Bacillus sp. SB49]
METVHWLWKRVRQKLMDRPYGRNEVLAERYQIKKVLQNGSYGIIYLCKDLNAGDTCVVKQMRKSKGKENKENYEEETSILQRLKHPGIPALIETFSFDGEAFFSMEFIEGKNVEDTLFASNQKYSEKECLELVQKLMGIVCYIHQNDVFHGDIRIPNVLLHEGEVHLIDFGLAHTLDTKDHVQRERLARDDFFDVGDFLLFLLYSSYEGDTKRNRPWTEELTLHPLTTKLLKRLLEMGPPYNNGEEILGALEQVLARISSRH